MAAILKSAFSLRELKIIVTLILLAVGMTLMVRKQPPKLIRKMNIEPKEKKKLKNLVGLLAVFAALLYPAEVCLSIMNVAAQDFVELFWSGGLIIISIIWMLLINYYQKK